MARPIVPILLLWLISCGDDRWEYSHDIILPEATRPLGMAWDEGLLWVSDPDNHQVLAIDEKGDVSERITGLFRPMHIDQEGDALFIPNFMNDTISIYREGKITSLETGGSLDAPAGVSIYDEAFAVADFYHHRVLLSGQNETIQIGKEGRTDGLLYYPTDVELTRDKVVVADAYNNRVQVFDRTGNFEIVIGWREGINVATGVDVSGGEIYVTDYYGNRVLIYDFNGSLLDSFKDSFDKPTDILVTDDHMYVANYGKNTISVYRK